MHFLPRTIILLGTLATFVTALHAQDKLKDGTTLTWDRTIKVGSDSLMNDTAMVPALSIPVYEASASDVADMLKKAIVGADFKKNGKLYTASNVNFPAGAGPVDLVATIQEDKKANMINLKLARLQGGKPAVMDQAKLEEAMHDLSVQMNRGVVQGQLDGWKKQLDKAGGKTESATKTSRKVQDKLTKAQDELAKASKQKSSLQAEHSIMESEIELLNRKWTLSQSAKDLKQLTKARSKITKNESKMADAMKDEADSQKDIAKNSEALPDAQKTKDDKAASQADVQRTVDTLQRKLENIR